MRDSGSLGRPFAPISVTYVETTSPIVLEYHAVDMHQPALLILYIPSSLLPASIAFPFDCLALSQGLCLISFHPLLFGMNHRTLRLSLTYLPFDKTVLRIALNFICCDLHVGF
jgi:hypothetical protein